MKEPNFPTSEEIGQIAVKLKAKKPEGYAVALKMLAKGANTYMFLAEDEYEWELVLEMHRKQMDDIEKIKDWRARALAILITDFLNGHEEPKKYLMGM